MVNSISMARKSDQKKQEIDISDNANNIPQIAVENSIEFRTNKPLTTTKKFGKFF